MYFDGINLAEGSVVSNLTVASGATFPASPSVGELFYLNVEPVGLYIYNGSTWTNPGEGAAGAVVDLSTSAVSGILSASHVPAFSGDVTSSAGSTAMTLANSGVTAGTYNKVTVDAKGRVVSATQATTLASLGITDAASLSGSSTSDFAAQNLTLSGDLLPAVDGVQNIGSSSLRWSTIFVNEAKLSVNTLYIGDTAILGTQADTIRIKADPGQSIWMSTVGVGSTLITSENQVQISSSGLNADVIINATGTGSDVRLGSGSSVQIVAPTTAVSGDQTIAGTLTVTGNTTLNGNLTVNGTQTVVNATTVATKDNIILVNSGEVGSGVTSGKAGIQVDRGDLADYQIVFDETDDMFKVGQVGNLETIASQNYVLATFAPIAHVGAGGTAHAVATGSVSGFMSSADKSKLDGIAANANNYVHPTSGVTVGTYEKVTVDANGHVTAGSALSASDIPSLDWSKISSGKPTTLAGYSISDAYTKTETDSRIQAIVGAAPAALDTLAELATQLAADESAASALTTVVSSKADISYVDSAIAGVTAGNVANAATATTLATGRSISSTGDVTWSIPSFDGSANVTAVATLANSGVASGTYAKVTVNAKGLVTAGAALSASDIPALDWSKITTGKPATLAGYGIGDAYTKTEIDTALTAKIASTSLGVANGVATLGSDGKVPAIQLPSYVDDVVEYAATGNFPATGESGKIYVATGTGKIYRWSGTVYIEISAAPGTTDAVTEGSNNLYFTDARAQAAMTAVTIDGGTF